MTPAEKQKFRELAKQIGERPLKDPTNVEVPEKPDPRNSIKLQPFNVAWAPKYKD